MQASLQSTWVPLTVLHSDLGPSVPELFRLMTNVRRTDWGCPDVRGQNFPRDSLVCWLDLAMERIRLILII